jgi:hypothetical protein
VARARVPKVSFALRIDADMLDEIGRIAEDEGRTTGDVMRQLLGSALRRKRTEPPFHEELSGKTPEELVRFVEVLDEHLRSIHQDEDGRLRNKTAEEQTAFDYGLRLRDEAMRRIDEYRTVQEVFRRRGRPSEIDLLNAEMERRKNDQRNGALDVGRAEGRR